MMILAPMQGLTEVLFRKAYNECFPGAMDIAMAPFISLTHNLLQGHAELRRNSKLADILPENNEGSMPVIPQILGKEPDEFIAVANMLFDLGYTEVNWNIGCPMRAITGKHRGSGILPYPDEVRAILDAIVPHIRPALSVKTRIGLRSKDEILSQIPVLNDYPLSSVTIHPRLGKQQYNGVPDIETFAQALPLIKHPVIYNGDIRSASDAAKIFNRFPNVKDIMIGRGVLYSPTLPLDIRNPERDRSNDTALAKRFINTLFDCIHTTYAADESRMRKIKEYWSLLWRSLPISELQAREVLRQQELGAVDNLINKITQ